MSGFYFVKVNRRIKVFFPKGRAYTETEAYVSLRIDLDDGEQRGLREYGRIWKWPKSKVSRFFEKVGYEVGKSLQEIAGQKRDKSGTLGGTPMILSENNLKESSRTPSGTKAGQKRDTTVKTKNKSKDIKETYIRVYDFWNSQKIIVHRKFPPPSSGNRTIYSLMDSVLEHYGEEEIISSIGNYEKILHSNQHYFDHSWALCDFLARGGVTKFFDWGIANKNYLKTSINGQYGQKNDPPTKVWKSLDEDEEE